ncbi:nitroreductase family protein [Terrisporobacter sp.]
MNNTFNKSITELIKSRHSVRTYENKQLPENIINQVKSYVNEINNTKGIFGEKIRIDIIEKNDGNKETKLGTYGVIKGANYYLVAAYDKNSKNGLYDLGYLLEKVVLYCTDLGFGTVWLGGTFNKGKFADAINLKDNESLPIVCPFGIESNKKTILAKMMGASSNKRKDFSSLFFKNDFNTPLSYEDAEKYGEVLENIRLSPSAVNKQPWKVIKEGNDLHIYSDGKIEMNKIDMGIALCHLELTAKEKGIDGKFKILDNKASDKFEYIISWIG